MYPMKSPWNPHEIHGLSILGRFFSPGGQCGCHATTEAATPGDGGGVFAAPAAGGEEQTAGAWFTTFNPTKMVESGVFSWFFLP